MRLTLGFFKQLLRAVLLLSRLVYPIVVWNAHLQSQQRKRLVV